MSQNKHRLLGVDLAKVLAMFFVVTIHLSNRSACPPDGALIKPFVDSVAMTGVDIFALASGYVGVCSVFKISRLVKLWLRVVALGCGMLLALQVLGVQGVSANAICKSLLPVTTNQYWYITAYFPLALFAPIINEGIKSSPKNNIRLILVALIVAIGFCTVVGFDFCKINYGYSFLWLLILYVLGAYWRLYINETFSAIKLSCCFAGIVALSGFASLSASILSRCIPIMQNVGIMEYTSPVTLALSIVIFALCLNLRQAGPKMSWIIHSLSVTSLSVYILHDNRVFSGKVLSPFLKQLQIETAYGWLLMVFIFAVLIYISGSIVEYFRLFLFKMFKIDRFAERVDDLLIK